MILISSILKQGNELVFLGTLPVRRDVGSKTTCDNKIKTGELMI